MERTVETQTPRIREDQQRFRLWLGDGRLALRDPECPYWRLGVGEAAALGLAQGMPGSVLLVNEAKGYVEAHRIGIGVVSVPAIVVRLELAGHIGLHRAVAMLNALEDTTSSVMLDRARSLLRSQEGGGQ